MFQDRNNVVSVEKQNKQTQQEVAKPNSRSVITATTEVRARQDQKGSQRMKNITHIAGFCAQ